MGGRVKEGGRTGTKKEEKEFNYFSTILLRKEEGGKGKQKLLGMG